MSSGKEWRESCTKFTWKNLLPASYELLPRNGRESLYRWSEIEDGGKKRRRIGYTTCVAKRDSRGSFSFWNATRSWCSRKIWLDIYFLILRFLLVTGPRFLFSSFLYEISLRRKFPEILLKISIVPSTSNDPFFRSFERSDIRRKTYDILSFLFPMGSIIDLNNKVNHRRKEVGYI